MKWKSLEAVEVISSKKKKGLIGKAYKYKNYLVIDLFKKGTYYGRYAIDLDTGEYGFRDSTVTHQWKLSTIVGGSEVYYHYSKKRDVLEWDTEEDRLTMEKSLGRNFRYELRDKEEEYLRGKRERRLELKCGRIRKLMNVIPDEPEHLNEWVMKEYGSIYFFLDDDTRKKCRCPICGAEYSRKDLLNAAGKRAKHNDQIECRNCKSRGLLKTRVRCMEQKGQMLLLQEIDKSISVARRFAWNIYSEYGNRTCGMEETIRIMMYKPHGYKIYYSQDGGYTNFYTGCTIPEWYDSNPRNKRALKCCLYPDGIAEALNGTDYKSLSRAFEAMAKEKMIVDYNAAMAVGCKREGLGNTLEYLLKGKFMNLLRDTIGRCDTWCGEYYGKLNLNGRAIEEVFGMKDRQKINRIRQTDGGEIILDWMRYSDANKEKITQDTLIWLEKQNITPYNAEDVLLEMKGKMSIEKVRNYLEKQCRHYKEDVRDTLEHWGDYLSMMKTTNQKLDDELFYKPKNLKTAHNAVVKNSEKLKTVKRMNEDPQKREKEAQAMRDKFPEAERILQDVREKYSYQGEEYIIRIPKDLVEIVEEGYALHHCGGSSDRYFNRICNRETYIGFCRKVGEENIPFYTIEFEPDGTIRQNRSYYDEEPDIDIIRGFLKEWQREIKKRLNREDLEYAKKSAELREQNIQELKEKKNNFVLQKLKEDFMAAG